MKNRETKSKNPETDCKECRFAGSCLSGYRLKNGGHWECIMDCSL